MYNQPKVSVLIPLYNAEKYIQETIQSILNQTYKNIEIIIVDDGSTDKSFEIAKQYESPNIIITQQPNRGPGAARNKAFELSSGEYIQYLDADDLLAENKIEVQLNKLIQVDDKAFVFCDMAIFYDDIINPQHVTYDYFHDYDNSIDFLVNYWISKGMIGTHTFLISRNSVLKAGNWNEEWILNEDGEFISRVIANTNKILYTPDTLAYYRRSNRNSLNNGRTEKHYSSQLSSFLSYQNLAKKLDSKELLYALAVKYSRLFYDIYPENKNVTNKIISRLKELGYTKPIPLGSKKLILFSQFFGYKSTLLFRSYITKFRQFLTFQKKGQQ